MTKRDFELIAGVIRAAPVSDTAKRTIAKAFATRLRKDNPRFDHLRFMLAATGVAEPITLTRIRAGLYEAPDGTKVERTTTRRRAGSWCVTPPGASRPADAYSTLAGVREGLSMPKEAL